MLVARHPLVQEFLDELEAQQASDPSLTVRSITDKACIAEMSVANWRCGHDPSISNLDRALRVLGYRLAIVEDDNA